MLPPHQVPQVTVSPFSCPVIALLMPASMFGVLARLGLVALMDYDGHAVFPLAYPQAVGCLIMGFAISLKTPIGDSYGCLYTAVTTGFCGSLTTFSGWQLQVFNAWINARQSNRGGFADFLDGVALSTITISLSLASLSFGKEIGALFEPLVREPRVLPSFLRHTLSAVAILMYGAAFLGFFLLPSRYQHQATAALIFSFPGTLTRYLLAVTLNKRLKAVPLGTLSANVLGTALLASFHVLQSTPSPPSSTTCNVIQGLADGYCGCLTTISTFVAELQDLGFGRAFRYTILSWALGQIMLMMILGSSLWTGTAGKEVTCSFQ